MKKLCALLLLVTVMASLAGCANAHNDAPVNQGLTVSVCVMDQNENIIIQETPLTYTDGLNAFDALMDVAAQKGIKVVHSSGYVTAIDTLAAGDAGEMSGWLFYVNGESPTVGASDYVLAPDDLVLWQYTA